MTGFLGSMFWALFALANFVIGILMRLFTGVLWLLWPLLVMGFLIATAQSAEAGWFSWLWGSDTHELERSLDVAREAARVASEASQAQAQQAAAQALQNTRLAETLSQLSSERSNLADHLQSLVELGLQDSQWAAAVGASGPMLVCITVLAVAGLALWLVNKSGAGHDAELAQTVDLLVEELATYGTKNEQRVHEAARLTGLRAGASSRALTRLPVLAGHGPELDSREEDEALEDMGPEDTAPEAGPETDPLSDEDMGPMPF
jgi:hypothetical protein